MLISTDSSSLRHRSCMFARTRLGRSGRNPDDVQTIRVLVEDATGGGAVYEEVPVEPVGGGRYRVLATPGMAEGFASDDVVEVDSGGMVVVLERGGNVGVQVLARAHDDVQVTWLVDRAERLGGWLDGFDGRVAVLTFPVRVGFEPIESLLAAYIERAPGSVEWYYANVYAADGVTPLAWW